MTLDGAPMSGIRRRKMQKSNSSKGSSGNAGSGEGPSTRDALRFYTDDAPGLKVGPTTVLVSSLMFIGCVVLLHIWGKFRA